MKYLIYLIAGIGAWLYSNTAGIVVLFSIFCLWIFRIMLSQAHKIDRY